MSTSATADASLAERLANSLPKDTPFTYHHISTPPTRSPALFAAPPHAKPERTYTESHFLNVAIPTPPNNVSEVLVLAIEVLIYTTKHLTTIFVSKADSTGYLGLAGIGRGHASPLRTNASTFLEFLVDGRLRSGRKLVLSLFARASDQYLFPGSVENRDKHVSDDRQLIKWWCRVLDPVLRKYPGGAELDERLVPKQEGEGIGEDVTVTSQAYLIIPGEDSIAPYLPQDVRSNPQLRKRWKHGHPLREISKYPTAPPRCLVPHFPDDPKARFLDELDDEIPDNNQSSQVDSSPSKRGNGMWKSVRNLEQFWETMAFRQECSSGRLVGFVWVVFSPVEEMAEESQESQKTTDSQSSLLNGLTSPPRLSPPRSAPRQTPKRTPGRRRQVITKRKKKPLRGPIVPRTPKIKKATTSSTTKDIPEETKYYLWPASSRGELVLSSDAYKKATERLLALQFKNLDAAITSTKSWVEEVGVLAGRKRWGQSVVGRKEAGVVATNGSGAANGVNTMMMVKKKRKAADVETPAEERSKLEANGVSVTSGINMLGAGLVKKKKKVMPVPV